MVDECIARAAPPASAETTQGSATEEQAQGDPHGAKQAPIVPPRLLKHREPAFPSHLQAQGVLKGEVVALVTIGIDGLVTGVELTKADDVAFFAALTATLKYWRFEPAIQDGKPIGDQNEHHVDIHCTHKRCDQTRDLCECKEDF